MHGNTPVLVGCGQLTDRDGDGARSPIDLMAETARRAADDSGAGRRLLQAVDTLAVVNVVGWPYRDAPGLLKRSLAITPARSQYTWIGGNTPQWLVSRACRTIERGEAQVVLLSGAEAIAGYTRARRAGRQLRWETGGDGSPELVGDMRQGTNEHESAHGMVLPSTIYPLFENALRAKAGRDPHEHLAYIGRMCARLTEVAARNPDAWFQTERSAEEICTPGADNRLVAWPYTKYMNALLNVDQSASLVLTSVDRARSLGIDRSRWVFLHGYGDAHDLWWLSERRDYTSSPAIERIARRALDMAALGLADIDRFDLYSCFPSAVQIARDAIGIADDDPRPLTVTGGLAAHGGPGNNYVTHSIATMMQRLRENPGHFGLITGMGWYVTKHSLGIYGTDEPRCSYDDSTAGADQAELDRLDHPPLAEAAEGRGTIETYTVPFERDAGAQAAVIIGRLESGQRFLARSPDAASLLDELVMSEGVGRSGTVRSGADGINVFSPD